MSWFFRKPKHKQVTSVSQVKATIREFFLDSQIPNSHDISEDLGCPPISNDVAEREEEESDKRVEKIAHLVPLLHGYSTLFAEAFSSNFSKAMSGDNPEHELPPMMSAALNKASRKLMEDVLVHLLIGSVSQMVDLEFLEIPRHPIKRKR